MTWVGLLDRSSLLSVTNKGSIPFTTTMQFMQKHTKKFLIPFLILGGILFTQQVHAASFWAYYPLEIGDISDHSGNGRDLTAFNGSGVWPEIDNAAPLLSGSTNAIAHTTTANNFGNYPADQDCQTEGLNWNGVYSLSFWLKTNSSGANIFGGRCGTKGSIEVYVDGSGELWYWDTTGAHYVQSGFAINDNATHFFVLTATGTDLTMFVDDVLVDTDTQDTGVSGTNEGTAVGAAHNGGDLPHYTLDDVAFWTDALDQSEVDAMWNGGAGAPAGGLITIPTLSWDTPTYPTSTRADFYSWKLNVNDPDTSTTGNMICTYYDTVDRGGYGNTGAYTYYDCASIAAFSNIQPFWIPKSTDLYPLSNGTSTTWYAYSEWYDSTTATSSTLIANSATISFVITGTKPAVNPDLTDGSPYNDATSTTRLNPATLNCPQYAFTDTYFGAIPFFASSTADRITCEIKKTASDVLQWTFTPGQIGSSTQTLSNTLTGFKEIFPMSVYFTVTTAAKNSVASSTMSPTLSVDLPSLSGATVTSVPILTSTTLTSALTTTHCDSTCAVAIKDRIMNWLKTLIWASAGVAAVVIII